MNDERSLIVQEIAAAVIAVLILGGAIGLSLVLVIRGQDPNNVPAWLTLAAGAVIAWYFQSRNTNSVIATLTNGPLHTIASLSQRAPQRATDPPPPPPQE